MEWLKSEMAKRGHKVIRYKNMVEGEGGGDSLSYMIVNPDNVSVVVCDSAERREVAEAFSQTTHKQFGINVTSWQQALEVAKQWPTATQGNCI